MDLMEPRHMYDDRIKRQAFVFNLHASYRMAMNFAECYRWYVRQIIIRRRKRNWKYKKQDQRIVSLEILAISNKAWGFFSKESLLVVSW